MMTQVEILKECEVSDQAGINASDPLVRKGERPFHVLIATHLPIHPFTAYVHRRISGCQASDQGLLFYIEAATEGQEVGAG